MHKKSADKLNTWDGTFFPFAFFFVIFYIESNSVFIHTDDAVITDSNAMCIFSKVIDYRPSTIKSLFAMGNPFFRVTYVEKFLKGIVITIF